MATQSVDCHRQPLWPSIAEFLQQTLADLAGQDAIGVVNLPAPIAPLSAFLGAVPRDMSFVWHNPPSGVDCAGGGVAERIDVRGPERLAQLRERADALWARVRLVQHPEAFAYVPRLAGGLAFAPANSRRWPWSAFGDGTFSLARWTYGHAQGRAFLSLAVRTDGLDAAGRSEAIDELAAIMAALLSYREVPATEQGGHSLRPPLSIRQLPVAAWETHIRRIQEAIASGRFLKIVAARRCDVRLGDVPHDLDVLDRLSTESKCTHFAFRRAEATFAGASPELLFLKSGLDLRTQALAGTARSSGAAAAQAGQSRDLLGSSKDRSEHEFVVSSIRNALAPLCTEVFVAETPEVLALRNIIHINTPFEAKVRPDTHVTQLLEALHPTPAVGGVPGRAAREWIVEHETEERGWYTGPMGWFDGRGDAEFAVAIRCGVISGANACLYTGAGVVAHSNYIDEYAETALKQLPMLRALGLEISPIEAATPSGAVGSRYAQPL